MNYRRFLGAASAAVMIVIVITLALTSGAWAQTKFKTLYRFKGAKDGASPVAGLIFDQAGNLYGTTYAGGAYNSGTVFKLTPRSSGGWSERVLYSFTSIYEGRPMASLIVDAAGNLYGTTTGGYCTVFKLTRKPDGIWKESVLYNAGAGGSLGGLIFDQAGNLYGTTAQGDSGWGSVFELIPNANGSWTEKTLDTFKDGKRGRYPRAGLIFDQAGNLYGTTIGGGGGCGIVFELKPGSDGSWSEKVLYAFRCGKDGQEPFGAVMFDAAGNLYGTTAYGGGYFGGIAFELTPNTDGTWTKSLIHGFGKHGEQPHGGLVFDAAGNLYGTTVEGGHLDDCGYGCGVVFKLTAETDGIWPEKELHSFNDGKDGAYPDAGLIFDAAGNLYGTTAGDGTTTFGSVFEITP